MGETTMCFEHIGFATYAAVCEFLNRDSDEKTSDIHSHSTAKYNGSNLYGDLTIVFTGRAYWRSKKNLQSAIDGVLSIIKEREFS